MKLPIINPWGSQFLLNTYLKETNGERLEVLEDDWLRRRSINPIVDREIQPRKGVFKETRPITETPLKGTYGTPTHRI